MTVVTVTYTYILKFSFIITPANYFPSAPPPALPISCFLSFLTQNLSIGFSWSPSFTSQYDIEKYHVSVSPNVCHSEQDVFPNMDYHCPGLILETNYSFTVSAYNCIDQEGTRDTFIVQPQGNFRLINHSMCGLTAPLSIIL